MDKFNFTSKHVGINAESEKEMLKEIGVDTLSELMSQTIPKNILRKKEMILPEALSEYELQGHFKSLAQKNKSFRSFIGQGYYMSFTPPVIARNVFHNPGWYTQYTPYQAEIAQGRLEALLNFQTLVSDLTGLPIANASLLDEATAAAEAMNLMYTIKNKRTKTPINKLFVDQHVYQTTLSVLQTRATPLDIEIVTGDWNQATLSGEEYFGAILQFPDAEGKVFDYKNFAQQLKEQSIMLTVAADILSLTLLSSPGKLGADIAVGTTQRLGIPIGFGGPHAAFFATVDSYKRIIPGRIIGISVDRNGESALRMALQTREQHIKREKATSNICTAQALLAIMAGMYGVYHGRDGLENIASEIHNKTVALNSALIAGGFETAHKEFFDTIYIKTNKIKEIKERCLEEKINLHYVKDGCMISLDECTTDKDLEKFSTIFGLPKIETSKAPAFSTTIARTEDFLTHPVFREHRTETQLMRYLKRLENKDLSLVHSMIPLGSCTMKLNAASQLMPISNPAFADIHPMVPSNQVDGYLEILVELKKYLCEITGFEGCSLQPNSGAQGEFAGLMTIRNYLNAKGEGHRNIAIIPSSAHGTNPASAVMAGMKVIVTMCDDKGNIDVDDLRRKAEEHKKHLATLMVTYPSTHGVFEESIVEVCNIIHEFGGLVYMDGANMNAQVGITSPADIGTDVCHLNLHKTFSIPHGGGGPGMGPICCTSELKPFLPGHTWTDDGGEQENQISSVSGAAYGSASILLISYAYIRLLGKEGMKRATQIAILNANYIKSRLETHYKILYTGANNRSAHELIVDLRDFKAIDILAEDIAKRLMDYSFHSPTLSFPVVGTIMIEPTESEDKAEIDLFCDALLSIKKEIDEIALGSVDKKDNVLKNAPHTQQMICADEWNHKYSRQKAAFPLAYIQKRGKFWPTIARVDNAKGDRNLICTCPDVSFYAEGT